MSAYRADRFEVDEASVVTADGVRHFLFTRPRQPRSGAPLVLLLHGHAGSARHTFGLGRLKSPLSRWLPIADREDLVVAALEGLPGPDGRRGWNDGRVDAVGNPASDDVGFAEQVVAELQRRLGIDPGRVFVMGMSNGGLMAFRLATEMQTPPFAIATVCASMPGEQEPSAARPVAVLMIAGTADPIMPFGGGHVSFFGRPRGRTLGFARSLAFWRRVNALGDDRPQEQEIVSAKASRSGTRVLHQFWRQADRPAVSLLRIEGGGHAEPSRSQRYGWLYRRIGGRQSGDIESAEEAWRFFKQEMTRRSPTTASAA
jgi:polyhydroxybutyrate depolymerase